MSDVKKLKIVFVCGDSSGPHFHDIHVPTTFFHKYGLFECESQFILDYHQLIQADILHFQRQYAPESYLVMKQLMATGKVCLFLCDDNIWEIPKGNPAISTYMQPDIVNRYQMLMTQAHAVTTSTPYLVELCKRFNPHSYQFRNLVDVNIANLASPGRDNPNEIRIGWTGTPHHHDDAIIFDDALFNIIQKYPQVKLVFMGYFPPTVQQRYPTNRYEYYNFVPVDAWYPCFANLDFDIGLVTLEDNPFNWAKTCRKFQEYSILSIPTIASPVGNYTDLPPETLFTVKTNDTAGWMEALSYVIEHKEERDLVAQKAYNYVVNEHSIDTFIFERAQLYYDVYARVTGTDRRVVWEKPSDEKKSA